VLWAGGGIYKIALDEGDFVEASLRGRLKLDERTGDRVVAGDRVHVRVHDDGSHTIEAVDARRSELVRRAPGRGRPRPKVIIANVDQVVIVLSASMPDPNPRMVDRLLVLAESNALPAMVVVNKIDLCDSVRIDALVAPWTTAGYDVLRTSVKRDAGTAPLRDCLCGRDSVLTGPSGVGKSSLLNAMQPGLSLRIGEVGDVVRKGRHTTVAARLLPLDCGGWVADTPGLREVGLWGVDDATLDTAFPEFRPLLGQCRFRNSCTHTHEPDCAILAAVGRGDIDRGRYASYAAMLEAE